MKTESQCLAELLYMVASYRRHNQADKAVRILQDIIALNAENCPDSRRILAICLYNLAEIYEDLEPKTVIARELFAQAADLWNEIEPDNKLGLMWYFGAMQGLQEKTDRLRLLGAAEEQARQDQDIA